MATGVDLLVQSLRGMGSGVAEGAQQYRAGQQHQSQMENERRKREQEDLILEERMGNTERIGALGEKIQNPAYTREQFTSDITPLIQSAAKTGDRAALQAIEDYRTVFDKRDLGLVEKGKANLEKKKAARQKTSDEFKYETSLSKEYTGDATTDRTKIMREAISKVRNSAKRADGPGDLALIFNYMKILDPNSVVRESEFRSAASARSFLAEIPANEDGSKTIPGKDKKASWVMPSWMVVMYEKAKPKKGGGFLLDDQRKRFSESAIDLYKGQLKNQMPVDERFTQRANRFKVPVRNVIGERSAAQELAELEAETGTAPVDQVAGQPGAQPQPSGPGQAPQTNRNLTPAQHETLATNNLKGFLAHIAALEQREQRTFTPEEKAEHVLAAYEKAGVPPIMSREDLIKDFRDDGQLSIGVAH